MDAILQESPFFDFGDDPLYPFARTGLCHIDGDSSDELKHQVRQFCPRQPGVYGMLDALGRLIYVGKSKMLRNRLMSYFMPNNEEDKAGRIVQSTCSIVWETQPSDFAALLREQQLIRTFQPRFNVQGIPRRQQPVFVCLGRQPAEQFYTSRQNDPKAICAIGPLFGASRAHRAVEVLNRAFLLRDCSSQQPCAFTDQLQLFDIGMRPGCLRLEIQSCLGPCISACSRGEYDQQVRLGRQFLMGKDDQCVQEIQDQMDKAARNLHFEQAAVLREDMKALQWLARRTSDLARARETYTFVYPIEAVDEPNGNRTPHNRHQGIWYLIRRGIIEGAIAAPKTAAQEKIAKRHIQHWQNSDNCMGSTFAPRPETLALVASWFRNNRTELKKTFLPTSRKPPARSARKMAKPASAVKV